MNPIPLNIRNWQKSNRALLDSLMAERERLMATMPPMPTESCPEDDRTTAHYEEMSTYVSQLVLLEKGCANLHRFILFLQGKDPCAPTTKTP